MHGLGNDYIYFDLVSKPISSIDWQAMAIRLSNRHTGIGGDGIVLIMPSETCDFRMRIFNADGSEAEMCGNASRCIGKYVFERGLTRKTTLTLETGAGVKTLHLHVCNEEVESVSVEMGKPIIDEGLRTLSDEGLRIKDKRLKSTDSELPRPACGVKRCPVDIEARGRGNSDTKVISPTSCVLNSSSQESPSSATLPPLFVVDMGNPHAVVMVEGEITDEMVCQLGPRIEKDKRFPAGTNVEFVRVDNQQELTMRVWERGSGETMACGTGACASAVAAFAQGLTDHEVTVHLRGGNLTIRIDEDWNVLMTGGATFVFDGEID